MQYIRLQTVKDCTARHGQRLSTRRPRRPLRRQRNDGERRTTDSKRSCHSFNTERAVAVFTSVRYSVPPGLAVTPVTAFSSRCSRSSRLSPCGFRSFLLPPQPRQTLRSVPECEPKTPFYETNPFWVIPGINCGLQITDCGLGAGMNIERRTAHGQQDGPLNGWVRWRLCPSYPLPAGSLKVVQWIMQRI